MHVKNISFLDEDIAAFDAPSFHIQSSEIASVDPQQRCMLHTSFRAFESGEPSELSPFLILLLTISGVSWCLDGVNCWQ